jgi:branched-chain amino acid transport system permease protein
VIWRVSKEQKKRLPRFVPYIVIGLFLLTLPFYTDLSIVSLFNKILIYGLLVMSLDLLVGYTGLLAFGHAAFFGIGAYTTGILIKHYHVSSFWLSAPAGVFMAVLAALVFGVVALRASAIYFLLITLAMGQLVHGIVHTSARPLGALTGGSDGLGGIPYPEIGFSFSFSPNSFYYFTLVILILCALLLYWITKSPFGYSLQGIRESEIRARTLGYNTWLYQYIAFIIGGLFAGVAGVLYVYYNGFISPEGVGMGASGLLWLMLIIGGSGTLWGGLIGSGVLLSLQYFVSGFTPQRWPLILGACFVGIIMFYRGGILPQLTVLWKKMSHDGSLKG